MGEARREANALREELLHRREEAGRLRVHYMFMLCVCPVPCRVVWCCK